MEQHQAAEPLAKLADRPVILVVDDEFLVRIVQVDILREAGLRRRRTLMRLSTCFVGDPKSPLC